MKAKADIAHLDVQPKTIPLSQEGTTPIDNVFGAGALYFIAAVALIVTLIWSCLLFYDLAKTHRWRENESATLLKDLAKRAGESPESKDPDHADTGRLSVEEIRQIVAASGRSPRGAQGLTQSMIALTIVSLVAFALGATLVSTATDSSDLRKTIVTSLVSILATIAGFYFGARTAQSSAEEATQPPAPRPSPTDNVVRPPTGPETTTGQGSTTDTNSTTERGGTSSGTTTGTNSTTEGGATGQGATGARAMGAAGT